jgi:hypothetical protein
LPGLLQPMESAICLAAVCKHRGNMLGPVLPILIDQREQGGIGLGGIIQGFDAAHRPDVRPHPPDHTGSAVSDRESGVTDSISPRTAVGRIILNRSGLSLVGFKWCTGVYFSVSCNKRGESNDPPEDSSIRTVTFIVEYIFVCAG